MVQYQIPVRRGDFALTLERKTELGHFVDRFRREGEGKIVISAPAGQPNESAAYQVLNDVRETMKAHGIVREMVKLEPYSPPSDPEAPILVGFLGYEAKGPTCGPLTRDSTGEGENVPYEQLGCALQANTAAMVANPRDLVMAREETARAGERRDTLWKQYTSGKQTQTEKSQEQNASLDKEAGTE
jgi:pilus assembly protein CpaD